MKVERICDLEYTQKCFYLIKSTNGIMQIHKMGHRSYRQKRQAPIDSMGAIMGSIVPTVFLCVGTRSSAVFG